MERATGGAQALKAALKGGVGLIVMDVRMPRVSGLEVARYLVRLDQTCRIPIILVTGDVAGRCADRRGIGGGCCRHHPQTDRRQCSQVKAGYLMRQSEGVRWRAASDRRR
ncbi:response regulator [Streptomyces sp. KL116D]|uniref:response regulator n=1 Tax=Streptomyces sp. KL116D TaxID=3045152 RepID=UPI0035575AC6